MPPKLMNNQKHTKPTQNKKGRKTKQVGRKGLSSPPPPPQVLLPTLSCFLALCIYNVLHVQVMQLSHVLLLLIGTPSFIDGGGGQRIHNPSFIYQPWVPRQGYCVQIHYRVYSSFKGFWPLLGNNNNNNRSIFYMMISER